MGAELCLRQAGLTARTEYVRPTEVTKFIRRNSVSRTMAGFDQFWAIYPRRIGKGAAQHAYTIARRSVDQDTLLEAVERYIRCKPSWQQFCHPRTWLSQQRWLDEYEEPLVIVPCDWWEECKAIHGGTCEARYAHGLRMQLEATK